MKKNEGQEIYEKGEWGGGEGQKILSITHFHACTSVNVKIISFRNLDNFFRKNENSACDLKASARVVIPYTQV